MNINLHITDNTALQYHTVIAYEYVHKYFTLNLVWAIYSAINLAHNDGTASTLMSIRTFFVNLSFITFGE